MSTFRTTVLLFEPNLSRRLLYTAHLEPLTSLRTTGMIDLVGQMVRGADMALISLGDEAQERHSQLLALQRINPQVPLVIFDTRLYSEPDFSGMRVQAHCNRMLVPLSHAFIQVRQILSEVSG